MGASDSWTASSDQEMNFFVLFALAGAAVALPSSRNGDKVVPDALACTKGTSLGDNLKTAFTDCAPATMRKAEKRMQLSRSDDQCYSYDVLTGYFEAHYADDTCVLKSIGWLNEDDTANEDLIKNDLISLDPVVSAPLFAGHADCVAKLMDTVRDHECILSFTEEQQFNMMTYLNNIASYECFLEFFEQGCIDYLSAGKN